MVTLEKMHEQIAKLQARADALIAKRSTAAIEKIRSIMVEHGLTTADIEAHIGGKKRGRKLGAQAARKSAGVAKYHDPRSGATWTGHGRAPAWIANASDRTKFLIGGTAAIAVTKAGEKATSVRRHGARGAAAKANGKLPPKYRDPKTGATWSGHARPPAWIKNVKDRSKYLIAS
ncbi:H-NS family nucleoid-associated regulatory protein [Paraburkholderia humisilvae]|uniref:DNA-binding protein H-NS-like C-terminal domain-containing protein n=1 Tax=Paraburkholderia humisilvae TaxID=627669 RepID=A0A6J5DTS3_9BURK|nr:H-NS family nucleoid-associated regulatory protein [Paraburkholderia humisilvae]CAB3757017.1 hypothetical protein LMG29542_02980 [Paraburkholderia humisilvae]